MAKHKSNYKGNKSDKFVLKVFIGFAIVFVALISSIIIYNATKDVLAYDDFEKLGHYGEMTTQPEDTYLLYLYSESCGYCKDIKEEVLAFTNENNAGAKVYLMDIYDIDGENPDGDGTPTMFVVENGVIVDKYVGPFDIPAQLLLINEGTHPNFQ